MKRKILFALVLVTALTLSCLGTATAAPSDATLFPQGDDGVMIQSIAANGDTLYALGFEGALYRYQLGMEQPEIVASLEEGIINYIYLMDGQLYGLNYATGQFAAIAIADGAAALTPVITLDLSPITVQDGEYSYPAQLIDTVFTGDTLYLLAEDYMSSDYGKQILVAYSLSDSKYTQYNTQHIMSITPYKEGKMLVKIFDRASAYSDPLGEEKYPELHILDLAADTTEKVAEFDQVSVTGLRYRADNDTLYYYMDGTVMMMPALGTPKLAAYIAMGWLDAGYNTALMDGGLYAACNHTNVIIKNIDPAYLPTGTLTIYGGYPNNATMAFAAKYPDVAVVFSKKYYNTPAALAQAMVGGEDSLDIIIVTTGYDGFTDLLNKGYCYDLSGNYTIVQTVGKMYPFVQDAVSVDGKVSAIPLEMRPRSALFGYDSNALLEAGLSPDDLPTNYIDLCAFATRWNNEFDDGLRLTPWASMRNRLFPTMIDQYIAYYEYLEENLTFETPLFRSMMTALDNLDSTNLDFSKNKEEEFMNEDALLECAYGLDLEGRSYYTLMPMALSPDTKDVLAMNMQVAFVNPRSANKEMAEKLLEYYLEYNDMRNQIVLRPDLTDPIPNPDYEELVTRWKSDVESFEAQLATCAPEETKDLESQLARIKELLANQEAYRYTVTAQAIADYQTTYVPQMFIMDQSILNMESEGSQELQGLMSRYLDKQITLDQFIKEADSKLRMILLEQR